jgi:hypothetical protein
MAWHKTISKLSPFAVVMPLKNVMDRETVMCELPTLQVNWIYGNQKHTNHDDM